MSYELTGTTASSTYGRLVQIVDNLYYDGFGNLLNLGGGTYAIGPQGSIGATGPQGSGITGSTGSIGATGPQGSSGTSFVYEGTWDDMVAYFPGEVVSYNGSSFLNLLPSSTSGSPPYPTPDISPTIWGTLSTKGATGPQGATGNDGSNGATGSTGPQGATGNDGLNGATGSTGPQGATGNDGSNGATGSTGPQGATGNDGLNGATGSTGPQGATGNDGLNGATGSTGPQGEPGVTGSGAYFIQEGPPAPTASNVGDRWYDLSTGQEFVWINDGDSSQWVVPNISSSSGPQGPTGSGSSLTYKQIGFGDSSNNITSSGNLTFDDTNKNLILGTYPFTTLGNQNSGLAFGTYNRMYAAYQSSVIGGNSNILGEYYSSYTYNSSIIGGSCNNLKFNSSNTILGGDCNNISYTNRSTIIGGYNNNINPSGYNSVTIIGSGNSYINGSKPVNTNYSSIISSNNSGIYNSYNSSIIGGSNLFLSGDSNVVLMPSIMTSFITPGYSPASGFKWKLGGYNKIPIPVTGYIEVSINGVVYKLLAGK